MVEHDLAKVGVEGSNPFARSRIFEVAKFDEGPLCQRAFRFSQVAASFVLRTSRKLRDFTLGIEVLRLPAEFAPRLGAAQPLIERVAAGPVAQLDRDRIG